MRIWGKMDDDRSAVRTLLGCFEISPDASPKSRPLSASGLLPNKDKTLRDINADDDSLVDNRLPSTDLLQNHNLVDCTALRWTKIYQVATPVWPLTAQPICMKNKISTVRCAKKQIISLIQALPCTDLPSAMRRVPPADKATQPYQPFPCWTVDATCIETTSQVQDLQIWACATSSLDHEHRPPCQCFFKENIFLL